MRSIANPVTTGRPICCNYMVPRRILTIKHCTLSVTKVNQAKAPSLTTKTSRRARKKASISPTQACLFIDGSVERKLMLSTPRRSWRCRSTVSGNSCIQSRKLEIHPQSRSCTRATGAEQLYSYLVCEMRSV